jgi:hypothetical protein
MSQEKGQPKWQSRLVLNKSLCNQRFGSGYVTKSPTNRKGLKGSFLKALKSLAGRRGFEPRFTESESVVLPLNDLPIFSVRSFELGLRSSNPKFEFHHTTKDRIVQSEKIFFLRVSMRPCNGISSWDLFSMFLNTAFPRFNSSSPRMRVCRAFNLSALRI